jgi:hypothetical protein
MEVMEDLNLLNYKSLLVYIDKEFHAINNEYHRLVLIHMNLEQ